MAALEKTFIYSGDSHALKSVLSTKTSCTAPTQKDSNYVDLNDLMDLKLDDTKTVKVSFNSDANQLAVIKSSNSTDDSKSMDKIQEVCDRFFTVANVPNVTSEFVFQECLGNGRTDECEARDQSSSFETASSSEMPQVNENFTDCPEFPIKELEREHKPERESENVETKTNGHEERDLQYNDVYLSEKSESDDEVSIVVSDYCIPEVNEDESHYITTHEIQLSELDHDVDCDLGMGSSWDIDDDHQVYSFVDYASFDSDEPMVGEDSVSANVKSNQAEANMSEAAVSSKPESDLRDTDKHASSDEKLPNNQNGAGNTAGQIQLSIKATSRAIKEPCNVQEKEKVRYNASHTKDASRQYDWHEAKGDKIHDGAKCLIALPGRLHFGSKLKGKDHEYSSGASSAVSDLDDADKEVRNLTAKSFRSLAYPYFDAINFSTSSESSASEHGRGINRWSKFVDLQYGSMNVSKGRDHSIVSHKSSATNFQFARKRGSKGIPGLTLTSMRAPPVEIFALNGSLVKRKNASTKKIELMSNFRQEQSGVIRLTETLNFCCNVKAGPPGNERRAKYAQNTGGSRSTDDVTNTLPSGQGSESGERSCNAGETMEDTHKKAIFASSLLKNVISKKMQFEQERKMERGEICEPNHTPSPSFTSHEHETAKERLASKGSKGLQRQSSRFSEPDSDFTIVCLDELGDIVDSNSCDAKDDCHREETLTLASEPNLVSTNEAGFDTKKGAFEPSKSTLLRSQNSAFRSWRDGELEFQKERKNDKTPERKLPLSNDNRGESELGGDSMERKMTKMSHLFVPSIQLLSNEREVEKTQPDVNCTVRAPVDRRETGGMKLRSDNTLYLSDAVRSVITSKSPEIKIRLRSVKDNKSDPFSIAKLLTPNIGGNAGNLIKAVDDTKCQALVAAFKSDSSDKVPHFMVRDIRDNKGKLQTPIHQVRDVRKLVKSSYHFVSLDNENKSNSADVEHKPSKRNTYRNLASLSPMVIKCQSVNTNSNVKQSMNSLEPSKHKPAEDMPEADRSSPQGTVEGNKTGTTQIHKQISRLPLSTPKQEGSSGLKIETRTATKKQDKISDTCEKKTDSKMAALEKLQAAVKTMEQLYVFDRNEWKRKSKPQPITDSHVLSLIASEEYEGTEEELGNTGSVIAPAADIRRDSNTSKTPPSEPLFTQTEMALYKEEKEIFKTLHTPVVHKEQNGPKPLVPLGGTPNKTISSLSLSQKCFAPITASSVKPPQMNISSLPSLGSKGMRPKSPKLPVSLKITQPRRTIDERQRPNGIEAGFGPVQFTSSADSESYLTIPVKPLATAAKQPAKSVCDKTAIYTSPGQARQPQTISPPSHLGHSSDTKSHRDISHQSPKRSSIVMETQSPDTPTATIYHHALPITMQAAQPQVICFSPAVQPSPVPTEHFQPTQRKMLLDPSTGSYYLVDTPVQPTTRRLFDPETCQYVDVPMPPHPPVTPVPMSISPLAFSPGGYSHTYMFYPGYMPTPVIPARTVQSQLSMQSEVEAGDKAHFHTGQKGDEAYVESPYYVASGKSQHPGQGVQHIVTGRAIKSKQPVISITSQQGPRIIAPPSFDGTTMSFVVEHR